MKVKELLEQYKALSREQLIEEGRKNYAVFGEKMNRSGYKPQEIVSFATMLVRLAAGADRRGSKDEFELFQAVTGIETDEREFSLMAKNAHLEEFVSAIDEIVDSLDRDAKEAVLKFAAIFFAADSELNEREVELFKRLEA